MYVYFQNIDIVAWPFESLQPQPIPKRLFLAGCVCIGSVQTPGMLDAHATPSLKGHSSLPFLPQSQGLLRPPPVRVCLDGFPQPITSRALAPLTS